MNTMKRMTTIAFIILSINIGFSQTWKEWFNQKKTQKEYLVKQIAALKVYANYLKEGYDIAQKGLSMVSDIKGRNFGDHMEHFGSLKIVKDDLGNDSRIHLILTRQVAIINELRELKKVCRNSEDLTEEEVRYIDLVYSNLLKDCDRSIATLDHVISDGAYQMTDDERIESIEVIYRDMNTKYAFTRTFCGSTEMLIMQRSAEKLEIESARSLNGVL
jgi:hypothetical protein